MNAELIELIESTPDTVLSLTDGDKCIVREALDEVVARMIASRRSAHAALPVHAAT